MERRVVIVDDTSTLQGMSDHAFSRRPDFRVVGFAADSVTAAEVIRRLMPDIVTIDLSMPYLEGEALLETIRDLPSVCKIVVSDKAIDNRLLSARLLAAGASACLAKSEFTDSPATFFTKVHNEAYKLARGRRHHLSTFGGPVNPVLTQVKLAYPVPSDEQRRLAVGKRKALFNAASEPCFDTITRNAATLTAFPMSLLTFIDRDTQWIKSAYGVRMDRTPRDQAFCNYTISQGGAFVVANAAMDERFSDLPSVTGEPHIRTYTGLPVTTSDGVTVGSLCVIDSRVRTVSRHALDQLAGMAEIVAAMIDLRPRLAA